MSMSMKFCSAMPRVFVLSLSLLFCLISEKTVASHPRRGFAHASPQRLVLHVREVVVLGELALRVGERAAATRHGRSRGRAGRVPLAFRRVCLRLKNRWVPTRRARV